MIVKTAIVPYNARYFCIQVKYRKWYGFWSDWTRLTDVQGAQYWNTYEEAQYYSDQAVTNGIVLKRVRYPSEVVAYPIIRIDEK